MKEKFLLRK